MFEPVYEFLGELAGFCGFILAVAIVIFSVVTVAMFALHFWSHVL